MEATEESIMRKQLCVSLHNDKWLAEALAEYCYENGMVMSGLFRKLVIEYFDKIGYDYSKFKEGSNKKE